ncbi:MAG: hypothetical protein E7637_02880 [Ruminococcaceae bacterium]|nr:hypothetical protein [Oscillospiraceae bacterium]
MKKKLLLFLVATLLLSAMCLVACSKGVELKAPTNIRYDGTTITWDAVENAENYVVKIGDKPEFTANTNSASYVANGAEFTVSITAKSKVEKLSPSKKTTITFKPMDSVQELRVSETAVISWDPVANATGYLVRIDGEERDNGALTEFAVTGEGAHSIQVRPVIQGDDSYYSVWSATKAVTVLGSVNKDSITYSDGLIHWNVVQGAVGYDVLVNGISINSDCKATSIAYDSQNIAFEVSIKALGNHTFTFDGTVSETKKFVYLDPVSDIRVEDGVLKWSPVENATGYIVKLNGNPKPAITACEYSGLSVNATTDVQIMPISSDSTYFSAWSANVSILLLPAPVLQWNEDLELDGRENNNIFWDGVANAAGYVIRVTDPTGTVQEITVGETQRVYANAYLTNGTYTVEIKSLAGAGNNNVYDSGYSAPITVTRLAAPLAAPENFIVSDANKLSQGFTVSFQSVAGATQYRLFKDGVLHMNGVSNQFKVTELASAASIEEQIYNFKVQAVGSVTRTAGRIHATLSSLSDDTLSFSIKVLATPATPDISGFTYTYGSVNGSMGYVIDVGGKSYTSSATSYELSMLEAGNYSVSVCAKGNGSDVLPSNYSAPIAVTRLEAPTNLRIDTSEASEGVLTFTPVLHATGYYIVFNNDGNAIPVDTMSNINEKITEEGTPIYMLSSANYFNEDRTVYYMESQPGTTTNFIKLSKPTFGEVKFNGSQLMWNAPANINTAVYTPTYEVYNANNMTSFSGVKNGTTMELPSLEGGMSYSFQVKAIGNGTNYINSDLSTVVTLYKLHTPNVSRVDGAYTWSAIANATNYVVYVDGVKMDAMIHQSGSILSYTPHFEELKTYQIDIYAIGDGGITTIDSSSANIQQMTKQLQTPDFELSYSEEAYSESGKIIVSVTKPSPWARGYAYTIGGATHNSAEESFEYLPSTVGEIPVRVYALGGGFDDEGVYYLDSQSQGGNSRYTIVLLASPNPASFKLTGDGFLSWPAIADAIGYEISISIDGGAFSDWETVKTTSMIIENYSSISTLTVQIRAKGNGSTSVTSQIAEHTWYLK